MDDSITITREEIVAEAVERIINLPTLKLALEIEANRRINTLKTLTAEEVAEKLQVPVARVYRMRIPRIDLGARTVRFPIAAVEEFVASRLLKLKK